MKFEKVRWGIIGCGDVTEVPVILSTANGQKQWEFEPPQHVHQPLVETIVAELTEGKVQCPSTGENGARANWVMGELVKERTKCCNTG